MARLRRHDAEDADRFLKYPETIRLEQFAERFSYGPKEISLAQRIAGIRAALELADHLDSPAARYIYGTTLLAGRLGMTDQEQAHKQFELAAKKISTLVSKGDPRATFYYGLMINSGLGGLETNNALSTSMILQVVNELPTTDLIRLKYLITDGSFNAAREVFFGESLLGTLADRGEKTYPGIVELGPVNTNREVRPRPAQSRGSRETWRRASRIERRFADSPSSAGTTARLHCAAGTWPGRIPKGQDVSALEERPE